MGCCLSTKASDSDVQVAKRSSEKDTKSPLHDTKPGTVVDQHGNLISYHVDQFGHRIDDKSGGRVWSEKYYKARRDADEHAKMRGECFDKSKKAFNQDRKAQAKALSDEGKMHGTLFEEAQKAAAQEILVPQNLKHADKIDLHGLLVTEAIEATKEFVVYNIGRKKTVDIVTGVGHHSEKGKGPVIKPAIIDLCKTEGWKLEPHENNEGSYTLYLPSK